MTSATLLHKVGTSWEVFFLQGCVSQELFFTHQNFFLELDGVNKLQDPPSWKRSYIIDGLIKKFELIFVVYNFWFKRCFHVYYSLNQFAQNNEQFGEACSLSTFAYWWALHVGDHSPLIGCTPSSNHPRWIKCRLHWNCIQCRLCQTMIAGIRIQLHTYHF